MDCIRRPSLIVNCGYARVSIYQNSNPARTGRNARRTINTTQRLETFRSQFSTHLRYGIPDGYFEPTGKDSSTQFDRDCNKVLDGFLMKFQSSSRESYLDIFSFLKWSELSNSEKSQHTLSHCTRCFELHKDNQDSFPLKPIYQPKAVVKINEGALRQQGVKIFTNNVLSELNRVYTNEASTSFTDAILQTKSAQLERKKEKNEKRKLKRDMQNEITKKVCKCFAENAAITLLKEGESRRKYHRKRLAQSFCTPKEQPESKKRKTHSPNFEMVSWNTEHLQTTLQNWPRDTTINFSAVGKEHGILGGNAGQVVKEFAEAHEIDLSHIKLSTPNRKTTRRPCKRKLPGFEISIPSNPPLHSIETEIQSMIASGRFTLGEECAPYKITKYVPVNGVLSPHDTFVQARKVPLKQLRQKLLKKHLNYMRLTPTSTITAMTEVELKERLQNLTYLKCESMSHEELCQLLIRSERSRSLCMWHDHATILKMGFIMVTVHAMYDPMVYYTDEEYLQNHPSSIINVQSEVEEPQVYFLSAGSSSGEDQAALIGDRINCLLDLPTPVQTDNGIAISDTLRFFTGDHPATQFEQGSKQGGTYKCATCGCKENMFSDQAHSLFHTWRPLKELQSLATGGTFGRCAGVLRPFDHLKVNELKRELHARNFHIDTSMHKEDLQKELDQILRGFPPYYSLIQPSL